MADVRCLLSEAADISRHEPAIVAAEHRLLFHEFDERAWFAAAHLRDGGVAPGTRVALWMDNDWRLSVLLMALIRTGAVAVPLSTRWPAKLVCDRLAQTGCPFVIADEPRGAVLADSRLQCLRPDALVAFADEIPARDLHIPLDRPAAIVFTSGSSGAPRGALLTYGNFYYNALAANRNIRLASHDRWLLSLPLCHVGGLGILFRCLLAGATMAIPAPGQDLAAAQEQFRATHLSLVGTQLHRLLRDGKLPASFSSVKAVLLGGGPVNPALVAEARRRGLPVFPSYGLTEMASQVTTMRADSPPQKQNTSGRLLGHRDLRIAEDGEILVAGDTLFAGYVGPEGVRDARDEAGWFHTGDLGSLDSDGYLTVRGRKDFMFISGGENIQPEEVEAAILNLGGIAQALVVPVDDVEFGRRPVAFLRAEAPIPPRDVLATRLAEWLPRYKIPVAFHPWPDELDRDLAKPDRHRAVRIAAALHAS